MILYNNCEELSIYLFDKITRTNDYKYLIKKTTIWDKIGLSKTVNLYEIWQDIYDEYCELVKDNSFVRYLMLNKEVMYLETRYVVVRAILDILVVGVKDDNMRDRYIEQLEYWDFSIDTSKILELQLEKMYKQLNYSLNSITIKKEELKSLTDKNKKQDITLLEQLIKLEPILGKNEIDPKTTSVKRYVFLLKEAHNIIKFREKNGK